MDNLLNSSKKYTLLYVEDEEIIRQNVESCLKYLFNVVVAKDGDEGLNKFFTDTIDLIITDIVMPNKDGIAMLEEIKKSSPHIPTIVTSAYDSEIVSQLDRIGVTKCVPKPFDIKQLVLDSMEILNSRV